MPLSAGQLLAVDLIEQLVVSSAQPDAGDAPLEAARQLHELFEQFGADASIFTLMNLARITAWAAGSLEDRDAAAVRIDQLFVNLRYVYLTDDFNGD